MFKTTFNLQNSRLQSWIPLSTLLFITACNTGETHGPANFVAPEPVPDYWDVPTPDYSVNPDRPVISLVGDHTLYLPVDAEFEDQGATAFDLQDGNLSAQIVTQSNVDLSQEGDYVIRYSVADSSNLTSFEVVRIIRVTDDVPAVDSARPIGATMSHMGYIEHLPADYGRDSQQSYPLLIYNHGSGANAQFAGTNPMAALDALLQNAGPPLLIHAGKWDQTSPFIVLMPQAGLIAGSDPMARLNGFVDYAIQTYAVDISRIYMTGWSQGGFISVDYAINFPERVAAILTLSAGNPFGENVPANFCDIETVPIWAFHGDQDELVSVEDSLDLVNRINQDCQPTQNPKLTIFIDNPHLIHHSVFNLTAMLRGSLGVEHDANYDPYDQSIFDWLLSYRKE